MSFLPEKKKLSLYISKNKSRTKYIWTSTSKILEIPMFNKEPEKSRGP